MTLKPDPKLPRLEWEVTELKAKNAELSAKNQDLTSELHVVKKDRKRQAQVLRSNLASINRLQAEVQRLQACESALRDDRHETQVELDTRQRKIMELTGELHSVIKEKSGVVRRNNALSSENARLRAKLGEDWNDSLVTPMGEPREHS